MRGSGRAAPAPAGQWGRAIADAQAQAGTAAEPAPSGGLTIQPKGPTTGIFAHWPLGKGLRLRTERFSLQSLRREDVTPEIYGWFQRPDLRQGHPGLHVPRSLPAFAALYGNWHKRDIRTLMISAGTTPVGFLWVEPFDDGFCVRTHNFVGNRNWLGLGVIHEARAGLMRSLFRMGALRVWGLPRADNTLAVRCYRDQGFREEGRLRLHFPNPDGSRTDAIAFGMLPEEFDHEAASRLPDKVRRRIAASTR